MVKYLQLIVLFMVEKLHYWNNLKKRVTLLVVGVKCLQLCLQVILL